MMSNLEKSEIVIAKILGLLLEWGIADSQLEFSELGLDAEFSPYFFPCVNWLQAEGIIRFETIQRFLSGSGHVIGPTITAHGLNVMGRSFSVGESTTTIGDAVKKSSKETPYLSGAGDFTGNLIGGLLKSLGSN